MNKILNASVGFGAGFAGGLIGLGGAELRLPYLVGVAGLTPHQAVPVNLAVSLATILAAIPIRALALDAPAVAQHLTEVFAIALGAVILAYLGVGWLRRMSPALLSKVIFVLLVALGVSLLAEAFVPLVSDGFLPQIVALRAAAGLAFGAAIGTISSVLGVAGGEVIIPTLVFAYGIDIKTAGTLSLLISVPTVLIGIARHAKHGAFRDTQRNVALIVPMALGSIAGAILGGLAAGFFPSSAIKLILGVLLIWSAWKVFGHASR
ncbi:sulfite exporter TauE/SafE family protein [Pseudorhodoplanes sp.]|uniref:sulfite exporter TauE/SafE family protein n=1 Tax=Pseudorhodoplanes sp. TaxID=1934341 RepID=UPI00391A96E7